MDNSLEERIFMLAKIIYFLFPLIRFLFLFLGLWGFALSYLLFSGEKEGTLFFSVLLFSFFLFFFILILLSLAFRRLQKRNIFIQLFGTFSFLITSFLISSFLREKQDPLTYSSHLSSCDPLFFYISDTSFMKKASEKMTRITPSIITSKLSHFTEECRYLRLKNIFIEKKDHTFSHTTFCQQQERSDCYLTALAHIANKNPFSPLTVIKLQQLSLVLSSLETKEKGSLVLNHLQKNLFYQRMLLWSKKEISNKDYIEKTFQLSKEELKSSKESPKLSFIKEEQKIQYHFANSYIQKHLTYAMEFNEKGQILMNKVKSKNESLRDMEKSFHLAEMELRDKI